MRLQAIISMGAAMWGLSADQWMDVLTLASVLSAAGFGMLALLTEYKKDGRITRYGRVAAVGIALSALFSIGIGLIRDQIEFRAGSRAATERRLADLREVDRFSDQMAQFSTLATSMGQSLESQAAQIEMQKRSLTSAEATLRQTAELGRRHQADARRLLHTMWRDANRVNQTSITAGVSFECSTADGRPLPRLIPDEALARLEIRPAAAGESSSDEAVLGALRPQYAVERASTGDDETQFFIYTNFAGELEGFDALENWREASVSLVVSADGQDLIARYQIATGSVPIGKEQAGEKARELLAEFDTFRAIPCRPNFHLLVNGKPMASADGVLAEVPVEAGAPRMVLVFPRTTIDPDAIPRFDQ